MSKNIRSINGNLIAFLYKMESFLLFYRFLMIFDGNLLFLLYLFCAYFSNKFPLLARMEFLKKRSLFTSVYTSLHLPQYKSQNKLHFTYNYVCFLKYKYKKIQCETVPSRYVCENEPEERIRKSIKCFNIERCMIRCVVLL